MEERGKKDMGLCCFFFFALVFRNKFGQCTEREREGERERERG